MKTSITFGGIIIAIILLSFNLLPQIDGDYNSCFVKSRTAFGESCGTCEPITNTFKVVLKNTCTESLDVQVCVQGKYNRYRCYQESNVAVNDTVVAYDCNGTGSYLRWSRKAGDETKTFPSKEEVNAEYAK